jgi:two-component system KDP operon response regulator KdpE
MKNSVNKESNMCPTALIIEDNPVVREILSVGFEHRGWSVAEAGDAYRGLALFRELVPQLVTLDLIMPINDGLDSVQVARTITEGYRGVKVFVLSALAAEPEVDKFFKAHGIELFDKSSPENRGFAKLFARVDALFGSPHQRIQDDSWRPAEDRGKWTN